MKNTQCHYLNFFLPKIRRFFPFTVCLILLQTVSLGIYAQGNWLWANYWTGNDDPFNSNSEFNYVVKTAFDDEGNIYAFGSCGGTAQVVDQQTAVHLLNNPIVLTADTRGSVLVKFDRDGNLMWSRLIKNSGLGADTYPYDMFFDGDKIVVAGNYQFQAMDHLWFFDTLVHYQHVAGIPWEEQHPPYAVGNFTYFVTFDLDGNRLESVFVHTLSRDITNGQRANLCLGYRGFICADSHKNTYVAVDEAYSGADTMPYTIVVEKNAERRTYDIFLPENCYEYEEDVWNYVNNTLFCKFSPEWELKWTRRVVDHTNGLSPALSWDTINPYFTSYTFGLNVDNNDEMYLSGYLTDMMMMDEHNQYPMHIYWDSVHYATVLDYGMAYYTPYIIKYDSNGNVLWSNQAYVRNETNTDFYFSTRWSDNFVDNGSVYLLGNSSSSEGYNPLYYFDSESNYIPQNIEYHHTSYFVRFDKATGSFENFGINPGLHTTYTQKSKPAVINNHLFSLVSSDYNGKTLLCYYNVDGTYMRADTISFTMDDKYDLGGVIVSDDGYILCDMMNSQDLTFGHDMTLDLYNDNRSCAIIALKYDPSILEPYPVGVEQHIGENKRLKLYPNPATDILYIESEDMEMEQICFVDINGKEIMKEVVHNRRSSVNVSSLPAGMYLVKILSDGEWSVGKFIKIKY